MHSPHTLALLTRQGLSCPGSFMEVRDLLLKGKSAHFHVPRAQYACLDSGIRPYWLIFRVYCCIMERNKEKYSLRVEQK